MRHKKSESGDCASAESSAPHPADVFTLHVAYTGIKRMLLNASIRKRRIHRHKTNLSRRGSVIRGSANVSCTSRRKDGVTNAAKG